MSIYNPSRGSKRGIRHNPHSSFALQSEKNIESKIRQFKRKRPIISEAKYSPLKAQHCRARKYRRGQRLSVAVSSTEHKRCGTLSTRSRGTYPKCAKKRQKRRQRENDYLAKRTVKSYHLFARCRDNICTMGSRDATLCTKVYTNSIARYRIVSRPVLPNKKSPRHCVRRDKIISSINCTHPRTFQKSY